MAIQKPDLKVMRFALMFLGCEFTSIIQKITHICAKYITHDLSPICCSVVVDIFKSIFNWIGGELVFQGLFSIWRAKYPVGASCKSHELHALAALIFMSICIRQSGPVI